MSGRGPTVKQGQRAEARRKAAMLIGRKIVRAEPRLFDDGGHCGVGREAHYAHNWLLTLDDGSTVTFHAEETDGSEYGVDLSILVD